MFDTSLLGGPQASLATMLAAVKGVPEGMPHPLLPLEFPVGAPLACSTFGGSSGTGLGLDFLAVLALLSILSRVGGSSTCPREVFKLGSSPRPVAELPG